MPLRRLRRRRGGQLPACAALAAVLLAAAPLPAAEPAGEAAGESTAGAAAPTAAGGELLSDFVPGLSSGAETIAGMPIRAVTPDDEGILIELSAGDIPLSLGLLEPIDAGMLDTQLRRLRDEFLSAEVRNAAGRRVEIAEGLVTVGREGAFIAELEVRLLELRLEGRVFLDFARRLGGRVMLRYRPEEPEIYCRFPLQGIDLPLSRGTQFPGWEEVEQRLLDWARRGLEENDQQVMGIVLEIRRLGEAELAEEKRIVVGDLPELEHWASLRLRLELHVPELIFSRAEGVDFGLPSVMFQPLCIFKVFGMSGDERFRPAALRLGAGVFADLRIRGLTSGDYVYGYQLVPAGPALSIGYSGYFPRVEDYRLAGRSFGIGGELQARVNLVGIIGRLDDTRTELYRGDYVMDLHPLVVLHFPPVGPRPWDLTLGFPLKFFPNNNAGGWEFYSLGVSIGLRSSLPLKRFYRREGSP